MDTEDELIRLADRALCPLTDRENGTELVSFDGRRRQEGLAGKAGMVGSFIRSPEQEAGRGDG